MLVKMPVRWPLAIAGLAEDVSLSLSEDAKPTLCDYALTISASKSRTYARTTTTILFPYLRLSLGNHIPKAFQTFPLSAISLIPPVAQHSNR